MSLTGLTDHMAQWLESPGPDSDIVISSRVRLARNIKDYFFMSKIEPEEQQELEEHLSSVIKKSGIIDDGGFYFSLDKLNDLERELIYERHLISREHVRSKGSRGVAINNREDLSIMVNEEDHLRIQMLRSGFQLMALYKEINKVDGLFEKRVTYAFHEDFGYLTACPTNIGTGMRVSVMLHLPALTITREITKVFHAASKINLAVRGLFGEGTEATGDFYQISNQVSLGKSETDFLGTIERIVPKIVKYEKDARDTLLFQDKNRLEDRIWRAYGILNSVRIISSDEALALISILRMGIHMNIVKDITIHDLNEIFIWIQRAHLQHMKGEELSPEDRDTYRAEYIRNKLNK